MKKQGSYLQHRSINQSVLTCKHKSSGWRIIDRRVMTEESGLMIMSPETMFTSLTAERITSDQTLSIKERSHISETQKATLLP